uniref:PEST proteolytic signal-containing nuclear protein n=2 Tax=Cacopsylla melanoneura TaxID=428564 RepID=A0A8D8W9G3_9HEMI
MSDSEDSSDSGREPSPPKTNTKSTSEPPAKSTKVPISFGMKKPLGKPSSGIQIKFTSQKSAATTQPALKRPSSSVAAVFGDASDEEPEEMPPEAKMRMKNKGRFTPTSAGPNSFGKTKYGFIDTKKVFEKNLKEAALQLNEEEKNVKKKHF